MRFLPPLALLFVALAAVIALGFYLFRHSTQPLHQTLPLTLIMSGAMGNLIDRIRIGEVIDFLSIDFPDFIMDRWPVFNVADSAVSTGVVLMIIFSFVFPDKKEVTPEVSDNSPLSDSAEFHEEAPREL